MRRALPLRRCAPLAAPLLLAACVAGPDFHRPALAAGDGYGSIAATATGAPSVEVGAPVPARWWTAFGSPQLDALVEEALRNNPSITAADAALRAAHEEVKAQQGTYLPTVSASLQPTRQRYARVLSSPLADNGFLYSLTTTQLSISYAPDLFGANRRAVEGLVAQADQQRFQLAAARLTLETNVVQAAVQDALLRAEIAATRDIVAGQAQVLASYCRQLALGGVAQVDVDTQTALLAQDEATLPPLQKAFEVNRDVLAALVGRTPGQPVGATFDFASLTLPAALPLSLPARLVAQRPDVRLAEAQLHAASAQVGVAAAARLPDVQLDATGGSVALALTPGFNAANLFWTLGGSLTQPVFEGGTLRHRERAARAAYAEAAAQYRSTVIGAFQNTADALHALRADAQAYAASRTAADASERGLRTVRLQLGLGDVNRVALVNAEILALQARLTLLQAEANRYSDVAALFQALGGGWREA